MCINKSIAPIMMVDFSMGGILGRFAGHLDGKYLKFLWHGYKLSFQVDTLIPLMIAFLILSPHIFASFNYSFGSTFQEC